MVNRITNVKHKHFSIASKTHNSYWTPFTNFRYSSAPPPPIARYRNLLSSSKNVAIYRHLLSFLITVVNHCNELKAFVHQINQSISNQLKKYALFIWKTTTTLNSVFSRISLLIKIYNWGGGVKWRGLGALTGK